MYNKQKNRKGDRINGTKGKEKTNKQRNNANCVSCNHCGFDNSCNSEY